MTLSSSKRTVVILLISLNYGAQSNLENLLSDTKKGDYLDRLN